MMEDYRMWALQMLDNVKGKMAKVVERNAHKIPYITENGRYNDMSDNIGWWTNGFWGGLLWEQWILTGDDSCKDLAVELEEKQDKDLMNSDKLDHDNGFKWLLTAVYDYKRTGSLESRNRALLAANNMAGRFNISGNFIRAWNDWGEDDHRGWAIIDCMMNLPLLYWASEETKDPRFRKIAMAHADRVIDAFVRADGSVCHIVEFDPETGERVRSHGGQGYGHGSSWTRGQGWGIYGFMLSYIHTGEKRYLDTAIRIANYFIVNTPFSGLIPVDFRQPAEPWWEDSTAAVIAACGMIEISKALSGNDSKVYLDAALRMLEALVENRVSWDEDIDHIVDKGTVAYHCDEHETGILYGDFYFIEALMKLAGIDYMPW